MDRRDLIKASLLGTFAPFLVKIPEDVTITDNAITIKPKQIGDKRYYSPYFKGLGLAIHIQLSIDYDLAWMSDMSLDQCYRYINFPVEAIVDITYEFGEERWSGFNPKNHALQQFNMDRFFHAKFTEGSLQFGGHIELDGVTYKLASVSVTDKELIKERLKDTIYGEEKRFA